MLYVILIFLIILLVEMPDLIGENRKKEIILVLSILCFGFILSIFFALGINLPSPVVAIDDFLKDVLGLGYK